MGSALSMLGVPTGVDAYDAALEGLTEVNQVLLGKKDYPRVYDSGVKYDARPYRKWIDVKDIVGQGWADCEGLAGWRSAELRHSGEDPDAHLVTYKTGPHRYHAVVMRSNPEGIEDPSARLGMPIKNRESYYRKIRNNFGDVPIGDDLNDPWGDYAMTKGDDTSGIDIYGDGEPVTGAFMVVGEDPSPSDQITFDIYRHGDGFSGVLRLPLKDGNAIFAHTSKAATPKGAKKKGLALTAEVAKEAKKSGKKSRFGKFGGLAKMGMKMTPMGAMANAIPGGGMLKSVASGALKNIPGAGGALSSLVDLAPTAGVQLEGLASAAGQAMLLGALDD